MIPQHLLLLSPFSSQDLNSRAHAEVTIREALRELDLWGAGASFTLTDYVDSGGATIKLIKDWKDMVNQVGRRGDPYICLWPTKTNQ